MQITDDIKTLIDLAFTEDLGHAGDVTSALTIDPDATLTASFVAREKGVLAGLPLAAYVFQHHDATIQTDLYFEDGDRVTPQDILMTVSGNARKILQAERTALNFLCYLTGIASETARYIEAVRGTNAQILDTRKTLPGYRSLAKYAVKCGGGENHRHGLYDQILIKDNHIAPAGGITSALQKIGKKQQNMKVEIEVDTIEQLKEVLEHGGVDTVLLDNMSPHQLREAVNMVDGKIKTEASGGVDLETVRAIAETGVDYISIGALTHSVKNFDIGLDIC
jgi:nicotinate-nucleotide pyrophosphorylase (carboxylating)